MTRNDITKEFIFNADEALTIALAIADRCNRTINEFRSYTDKDTVDTASNGDPYTYYKVDMQAKDQKDHWGQEYINAVKLYKELFCKDYEPEAGVVPVLSEPEQH